MTIESVSLLVSGCLDSQNIDGLRDILSLPEQRELLNELRPTGIRAIDSYLRLIIMSAMSEGMKLEFSRLLVEFGADLNATIYQHTPVGVILNAIRGQHLSLTSWLHSMGAKINNPVEGRLGSMPLIEAVCENHIDIAKYLIENGAIINFVNGRGMSPLDFAANFPEMAAYLRSVGAKPGAELPQDHLPKPEPDTHEQSTSIRDHLYFYFGDVEEFPLQEIIPGDPPISLLKVLDWDGGYHGIVTDGMSSRLMNVPESTNGIRRAELVVLIEKSWPLTEEAMREARFRWPLDWLRQIARWPFESNTCLQPANIIANGEPPEPLGDNPAMTCLMVRGKPDKEWGRWTRPDGEIVDLLIVSTLYTRERDFELKHGLKNLLQLMEDNYYADLVSLTRKPLI